MADFQAGDLNSLSTTLMRLFDLDTDSLAQWGTWPISHENHPRDLDPAHPARDG